MKRWAALLALAAMIAGIFTGMARAADLELAAPSSILMERTTGEVLYEDNADERLRPASVTKVMTLLLVMEALEDGRIGWGDMVTTSAAAAGKGGSQIYLEENEQLPLEEMLKSVVVSSANDCACALAEHIAGSEAAFADDERTGAGARNGEYALCQLHGTGRWSGRGRASDDGAGYCHHVARAFGARENQGVHDDLDGHSAGRAVRAQQHE